MPRSTRSTLTVVAKVAPKVEVGVGTIAGLVAAAGQYAGALAEALAAGESSSTTIALITTATVTLVTTIGGRMAQGAAAVKALDLSAPLPLERIGNSHHDPGDAYSSGTLSKVAENESSVGWADLPPREGRDEDGSADDVGRELRERARAGDQDKRAERPCVAEDDYQDERDDDSVEAGRELEELPDVDDQVAGDEADGDEVLDPSYPGRDPLAGRDRAVATRLELERLGDGCAITGGGKS
jgi:hypothetical protein